MKRIFLMVLITFLFSCKSDDKVAAYKPAGATILETIKARYEFAGTQTFSPIYDARDQFVKDNYQEILKTMEVVEQYDIKKHNLKMVFYRYSVGTEIVRKVNYFRQYKGKWYFNYQYFSSYDDDPFKNGSPNEGKAMLKKSEEWEEMSKNIWWN